MSANSDAIPQHSDVIELTGLLHSLPERMSKSKHVFLLVTPTESKIYFDNEVFIESPRGRGYHYQLGKFAKDPELEPTIQQEVTTYAEITENPELSPTLSKIIKQYLQLKEIDSDPMIEFFNAKIATDGALIGDIGEIIKEYRETLEHEIKLLQEKQNNITVPRWQFWTNAATKQKEIMAELNIKNSKLNTLKEAQEATAGDFFIDELPTLLSNPAFTRHAHLPSIFNKLWQTRSAQLAQRIGRLCDLSKKKHHVLFTEKRENDWQLRFSATREDWIKKLDSHLKEAHEKFVDYKAKQLESQARYIGMAEINTESANADTLAKKLIKTVRSRAIADIDRQIISLKNVYCSNLSPNFFETLEEQTKQFEESCLDAFKQSLQEDNPFKSFLKERSAVFQDLFPLHQIKTAMAA